MQEIISLILGYVRGAWRYRWIMMVVAWLVSIVGWAQVYQIQDRYQSSARVYVDTRTILKPLMKGLAVQSDVRQQLALMTRLLLSRPNLEKVARMTDLDLKAKEPAQMDAIVKSLREQIKVSGGRRSSNIYTISCEHNNPVMAKRVVQSLLTLFVEGALGETRKDSDSAQRFLDKQISAYQNRLEEAERRRTEFKRNNMEFLPGTGSDYYTELKDNNGRLREARLNLREVEFRVEELQRQLDDEEPSYDFISSTMRDSEEIPAAALPELQTQYDGRIEVLQQQLDGLMLKYTEQHPNIVTLKETLEQLRIKQKQEIQKLKKQYASIAKQSSSNSGSALSALAGEQSSNPVYQQLKIALGVAEADLASYRARVAEYEERGKDLQERVDMRLDVEAKLNGLNRDYDIVKANFDKLLAKRETAQLSEEVEQRADNVKFKIVDPPRLPKQPTSPNRPLLISGVFLVAIAVGVALSVLMALVRPTFDTRRQLSEGTGYPVMGSISMNWMPDQLRKRKLHLAIYLMSFVALTSLYGVIMALHMMDIDVTGYIQDIQRLIS